MSSLELEEFHEELKLLSGAGVEGPGNEASVEEEDLRELSIAVPQSLPPGLWGDDSMKEVVIPSDTLDSIVRRYDSTSWSATGGKSSDTGAGTKPPVAAASWHGSPTSTGLTQRRGEKEGGAIGSMDMRGVSGARLARPSVGSRARALMLRAGSSPEGQRPGEVRKRVSPGTGAPGVGRQDTQPSRRRRSSWAATATSTASHAPSDSEWPSISESRVCGPLSTKVKCGRRRLGAWEKWCQSEGRDSEGRNRCLTGGWECKSEQENVPVIVESVEKEEEEEEEVINGHDSDQVRIECDSMGLPSEVGRGGAREKDMNGGEGREVEDEGDLLIWNDEGKLLRGNAVDINTEDEIDLLTGGELIGGKVDLTRDDMMRATVDLLTGGDLMGGEVDLYNNLVVRSLSNGGETDFLTGGDLLNGVGQIDLLAGGDVMECEVELLTRSKDDVLGEDGVVVEEKESVEIPSEQECAPTHNICATESGIQALHPSTTEGEEPPAANEREPTPEMDSSGEEGESERETVRVSCDCGKDQLESHPDDESEMGRQSQPSVVCGVSTEPDLPLLAKDGPTLIIVNIPTTVSEEEFEETLSVFGEVDNCSILSLPNEAGLHTAYVKMKERESCQWVISCFHDTPYGNNGASKPMVCYMLQHGTQHDTQHL